jgi:hypothetical protein
MAVITLEDNTRINTFSAPPPGFDPLVASASELERHGFPAKPDDPHLLKLYRRLFTRMKGRLKYVEPTFRISHDRSHVPRKPSSSGVFTGDNWSGGVRVATRELHFYSGIIGNWVVPNVNAPTPDPFINSYWIGLDGYTGMGANVALQAGVDCSLSSGSSSFSLWSQWVPSAKLALTNLAVSAGDFVEIRIASEPNTATATIYFFNISSGAATSYVISAPPSTQLVGNSGAWIVEAPDGAAQLADYGQVFFGDCVAIWPPIFPEPFMDGEALNIVQGSTVVSSATWITPRIIQCVHG